ncbi:hypothetical protein ILYODFUR_030954 [Ilyodon furcidens]|uniref:Uncharacterized protein n=1 Tax=Ilyodon furcidens TaxID=33524 RepID=A0ABV0UKZ1_9TELE
MQRYHHYGTSYTSPSPAAPVEEIQAEEGEVFEEEQEVSQETEGVNEEKVHQLEEPAVQKPGEAQEFSV